MLVRECTATVGRQEKRRKGIDGHHGGGRLRRAMSTSCIVGWVAKLAWCCHGSAPLDSARLDRLGQGHGLPNRENIKKHLTKSWHTTNAADKAAWQVQRALDVANTAERERLDREAANLAAETFRLEQEALPQDDMKKHNTSKNIIDNVPIFTSSFRRMGHIFPVVACGMVQAQRLMLLYAKQIMTIALPFEICLKSLLDQRLIEALPF
ncbi:hypothetical protein BDZ97DRAFT_1762528 [Flammula alnicola]|nr:hypothetical protein BDZ97DRAFT_1762528 [Flammula alnicola]